MDYPTVPIAITSTPTDWATIYGTLFAAFFGAAAAFWFSALDRRRTERNTRRYLINNSVYAISMTVNTLINIKVQQLHKFSAELEKVLEIASELTLHKPDTVERAARDASKILNDIKRQDQYLDNVFRVWQEPDFLNLTAPEDLAFTVEETPDLVRLLMTFRSEVKQVSKRIIYRNIMHAKLEPGLRADLEKGAVTADTLIFWGEMISLRALALEHADTALGIMPEIIEKIGAYRKSAFKKSLFAKVFRKKEKWVKFSLPEKWQQFIPDRDKYKNIIYGA